MITCPYCHRFVKVVQIWRRFDDEVRVESWCTKHGEVAADRTDWDELGLTDWNELGLSEHPWLEPLDGEIVDSQ